MIFYIDEFEVCNPIGSSRIKHKLTAVYFTLAGLPPRLRSQRKFIFLSLLASDKARKELGYSSILKPLIDDLNKLWATGVTLSSGMSIKPKLIVLCGDNLSSHCIGGFQSSFSSGNICRFCHCVYGEVSSKFLDRECNLRTPASISANIQSAKDENFTESCGVRAESVLFELQYPDSDLTKILLPDVMHDFLEGVVPIVVSVVVKTLQSSGILSLRQFNRLVQAFQYRINDTGLNPFSIELTSVNLKECRFFGTASQKCLLIHLPLILRDYMSTDIAGCNLLIKCREIGEIFLSDSIHKDQLEYLAYLIEQHHKLLRELAPTRITPKCHFLIHYPRIIQMFGPPRRFWTMRFEGKHQYFKDSVKRLINFKNLTLSLSKRCQTLQAVTLSSDQLLSSKVMCGPGVTIPVSELDTTISDAVRNNISQGYFEDEKVFCASWIEANGRKISKGTTIITDVVQEDIPLFAKVVSIINARSKWYLGSQELVPERFDVKTWSYICKPTGNTVLHDLRSVHKVPVMSYTLEGNQHKILLSLP